MAVLLVVFAVFTFAPPPAAPPAIAEVAPRAVQQITDAPIEQAVKTGGTRGSIGARGGPGGGATGRGREVLTPFRCVGTPPTQIEDPQSPPCVPLWEGDNGGATYQGVTKDTITVVVPDLPDGYNVVKAYQDFFNRRFQFYGRKLKLIGIVADQQNSSDEVTAQHYLASKVDEEYRAFATLPLTAYMGTTYYRELARRKVISVTDYPTYTQPALEDLKPYVWQYSMALDRIMTVTGDWICHRLAGRTADYTTDPELLGRPRKFGLIYANSDGNPYEPDALRAALRGCDVSLAVVKRFKHSSAPASSVGTPYSEDPAVKAAVLELKDNKVTSVLCLCQTPILGSVAEQSTRQNYFPEWHVATYYHHEVNLVQLANNPDARQRSSMFGLTFMPHLLRAADDPSMWALQEGDPNAFTPSQDTSAQRQLTFQHLYRPLLLLASGIQMAGPRLTPETFAAGLQRTVFPNPDSPLQAGKVGFLGGSYSMTIDAAEYWWSNTNPSPYQADPPGTWCYVDRGRRRTEGNWPGNPLYFRGSCDSGR